MACVASRGFSVKQQLLEKAILAAKSLKKEIKLGEKVNESADKQTYIL